MTLDVKRLLEGCRKYTLYASHNIIWHDKCHSIEFHNPVQPARRLVLLERAAVTLDSLSMKLAPALGSNAQCVLCSGRLTAKMLIGPNSFYQQEF